MLIRLLLALLIAAFTLPSAAMARCHDGGAMPGMTMANHAPVHVPAPVVTPEHGCVGCIPPADWLRTPVVTPIWLAAALPEAEVASLDPGQGGPPALPPPRMG